FPLWLPVRFRVVSHLAKTGSIGPHDKYISLIVISQRVERNPLTIGGVGRGGIVAAVGELCGSFGADIDAEDGLVAQWPGIDQQILSIRRPIDTAANSLQTVG